ncbi:MAG: S-methyl-5-thioribose-1-phosphate isomerase [Kiritimatiellia bacterium]|nr:S-methyl-5-thioribose-1-phosphate isomerase [Kiritimatiellia bacterium]
MKSSPIRPVDWSPLHPSALLPGRLRYLDQTRLPLERIERESDDAGEIREAIRSLQIRGAPAIGVGAALGLAAVASADPARELQTLLRRVEETADFLATARPTAVNLFWALDRMRARARSGGARTADELRMELVREALAIREEDAAMCRAIGEHGAALLPDGATVLTHCNAGGLATAELGTARAPVYVATEQGRKIRVIADETRPLLQGARLTAWELRQAGMDVTLICDGAAAQVMREGRVDLVLVGADRIAANGDAANKIGTYSVAVNAAAHGIPFYVAAPTSTIDWTLPDGSGIPIEQRDPREITEGFGRRTAPEGVAVYNPAFDVTPARLIRAILCEHGLIAPADLKKKLFPQTQAGS